MRDWYRQHNDNRHICQLISRLFLLIGLQIIGYFCSMLQAYMPLYTIEVSFIISSVECRSFEVVLQIQSRSTVLTSMMWHHMMCKRFILNHQRFQPSRFSRESPKFSCNLLVSRISLNSHAFLKIPNFPRLFSNKWLDRHLTQHSCCEDLSHVRLCSEMLFFMTLILGYFSFFCSLLY